MLFGIVSDCESSMRWGVESWGRRDSPMQAWHFNCANARAVWLAQDISHACDNLAIKFDHETRLSRFAASTLISDIQVRKHIACVLRFVILPRAWHLMNLNHMPPRLWQKDWSLISLRGTNGTRYSISSSRVNNRDPSRHSMPTLHGSDTDILESFSLVSRPPTASQIRQAITNLIRRSTMQRMTSSGAWSPQSRLLTGPAPGAAPTISEQTTLDAAYSAEGTSIPYPSNIAECDTLGPSFTENTLNSPGVNSPVIDPILLNTNTTGALPVGSSFNQIPEGLDRGGNDAIQEQDPLGWEQDIMQSQNTPPSLGSRSPSDLFSEFLQCEDNVQENEDTSLTPLTSDEDEKCDWII